METSGYQPVPSEPGGFTSMPVPVPEEEAPAEEPAAEEQPPNPPD